MANRHITFYHSPNTRSIGALSLLEELGAPYELKVLNMKGETRSPEYLAINPMGKVPAVKHGDALITEQAAIFMYLADLFPEAGLAPAIGDPLRGPYLRWMVYYGSCFEPAIVDKASNHNPGRPGMVPYGDYDTMLNTVVAQLSQGPYWLGEKFSAADVLWAVSLTWTTGFNLVPELPEISAYLERINNRPALQRARARDAELAEELKKAGR